MLDGVRGLGKFSLFGSKLQHVILTGRIDPPDFGHVFKSST